MRIRSLPLISVALATAVAAVAGCSAVESKASAATAAPSKPGIVTVSGHGTVDGRPDTLTLQIGVEAKGQSAKATLDDASERAANVIAALTAKGVAKKDIQTSQLSIGPTYDNSGHVTGFSASNMVTATLRDLGAAGAVIDAAAGVAGDAIRLNGVTFSIADSSNLVAAARADAVRKAKVQAQQLAKAAGVKLGAIRSIDETSSSTPVPQYYAANAALDRAAPIEPGTQQVSLDVKVVFELVQ